MVNTKKEGINRGNYSSASWALSSPSYSIRRAVRKEAPQKAGAHAPARQKPGEDLHGGHPQETEAEGKTKL